MFSPVYVIDGARTPFLKSRNTPGPFSASDLAVGAGRALLLRQGFSPDQLDEVILGCASPSVDETNIGRVVALRLGCGFGVPGWTVMRNCASGMQAIDSALANIQSGRSHLVLAGGVDALSRAPLLFSDAAVKWFAQWFSSRRTGERLRLIPRLKLRHFKPVIGLLRGLTDPVVGINMGQTAENLAQRFGITRQDMDAFAVESHRRAASSIMLRDEIIPLIGPDGTVFEQDDGIRPDSSLEALSRLKPVFDRQGGQITAGNASQVSDGAAWLVLASETAVERLNLSPIGKIIDSQWAALDPAQMGLGPVYAATPILHRHGLTLNDLDAWEINEAFSAQVLACLAAWQDATFCHDELGAYAPYEALDVARLN
ncbi:MAG: acetyl-CoA acyltransferase, partial [Pseudomonadota bacterium]